MLKSFTILKFHALKIIEVPFKYTKIFIHNRINIKTTGKIIFLVYFIGKAQKIVNIVLEKV